MKNRAVMLVFTGCLVSSLAFADNLTDAPLMTTDGNTAVVQQENCKDRTRRQRHHKKDKSLSSKRKHEPEHPSLNNREGYHGNPEPPAGINN
jgi:hypothetical protein